MRVVSSVSNKFFDKAAFCFNLQLKCTLKNTTCNAATTACTCMAFIVTLLKGHFKPQMMTSSKIAASSCESLIILEFFLTGRYRNIRFGFIRNECSLWLFYRCVNAANPSQTEHKALQALFIL